MEFHPAANIFPMMTGDEYRALVDDIRANGLREPITLYQGQILDGRNRYTACLELGIEPTYRDWNGPGSPIAYVVSLNLARRHLTSSQRAVIALEVERQLAEEAEVRRRELGRQAAIKQHGWVGQIIEQPTTEPGRASEQAAALMGTNRQYVSDAKRLKEQAPDLLEAVRVGEKTIPQAKHELRSRQAEELRANPVPPPAGKYATIIVDPPWPIEKLEREARPNQFAFDYPVMGLDEIYNFEIPGSVALDDCHLFMWTTQKFLPRAFDVLAAWNFRYVFTMVWHKPGGFQPYNLPQYNCEFILYARRGNPQFLETKAFFTCFNADRSGHSIKPDEFYNLIRRVCPEPRIEIFARQERDGFDVWGNEVTKDE